MVRSRAVVVAIVAAVLAGASVAGWWLGRTHPGATSEVVVVHAVDGDTVDVRLGSGASDTVRILGVDTPETHQPTKAVEWLRTEAVALV